MLDVFAPAPSSVLAFVSTIHAALLMVHLHRAGGAMRLAVALPAIAFGALAWILTSPAWLAGGITANLAWTLLEAVPRPSGGTTEPAPNKTLERPRPAPRGTVPDGRRVPASAPPSFVPATVLAVIEEAHSIRTFRLERPAGFDFEAGQFLMVRVPAAGDTHTRCYSISSAPETTGYLEISVRRQGLVSGALHDEVRVGDALHIHRPLGRFTGPSDASGDHVVLLAGGIGITPLMSMLRHTVAAEPRRKVTLLYSVRTPRDVAFRDELHWLAARHPQVAVVVTVTGSEAPEGTRRGRIDEALIHATVPDPTSSQYFMCGPLPMIGALRETLRGMGVAAERVRFEAFEAAVAVASVAGKAQEGGAVAGRLRLAASGIDGDVRSNETLLEAAERAGGRLPSFCRAGICGTCRTRVASGEVRCDAEALSERDREEGYVLPCVSWLVGDCVLEA